VCDSSSSDGRRVRWPGCVHGRHGAWTVGADGVRPAAEAGRPVVVPVGRLHAVAAAELIAGRARCGAEVALLDPDVWGWPDGGTSESPLCWSCLALTC
jgi:hypothetical protein